MPRDYITNPPPIKIDVNPAKILFTFIGLVLLFGILTSFYQVPADSVAVVQRFGAYERTDSPGLHFKLPFGIDTKTLLAVSRTLKLEFGSGTPGATNPYQVTDRMDQELAKNMVTGDLNSVMTEWVVQYHISDEKQFLFEFSEPEATLRDLSESVMCEVIGDRTVDEVLTVGRGEIESTALTRLEGLVTQLNLGIHINQVQLGNVNPPTAVVGSFYEVIKSEQDKGRAIYDANGEYNRIIPSARGEAEKKVSTAEGYALKRVNEAEGDATRFTAVLKEYLKAPEVTRKRLYFETMAEILPNLPGKIILDDKASQILPMLQIKQNTTANPNAAAQQQTAAQAVRAAAASSSSYNKSQTQSNRATR